VAHKNISIMVMLSYFQAFDCDEEISQYEEDLDLADGDTFDWYCGQFDGMAQVVSYQNGELKFKKVF